MALTKKLLHVTSAPKNMPMGMKNMLATLQHNMVLLMSSIVSMDAARLVKDPHSLCIRAVGKLLGQLERCLNWHSNLNFTNPHEHCKVRESH